MYRQNGAFPNLPIHIKILELDCQNWSKFNDPNRYDIPVNYCLLVICL